MRPSGMRTTMRLNGSNIWLIRSGIILKAALDKVNRWHRRNNVVLARNSNSISRTRCKICNHPRCMRSQALQRSVVAHSRWEDALKSLFLKDQQMMACTVNHRMKECLWTRCHRHLPNSQNGQINVHKLQSKNKTSVDPSISTIKFSQRKSQVQEIIVTIFQSICQVKNSTKRKLHKVNQLSQMICLQLSHWSILLVSHQSARFSPDLGTFVKKVSTKLRSLSCRAGHITKRKSFSKESLLSKRRLPTRLLVLVHEQSSSSSICATQCQMWNYLKICKEKWDQTLKSSFQL